MAVLTTACYLCEQPVLIPVPADDHVFCCHGCRELWRLLGDEEVAQLKSQPGVQWEGVRTSMNVPLPEIAPPLAMHPQSVTLAIDGMWCASCAILIEQVLVKSPGVLGARIDYASSSAEIAIDGAHTSSQSLKKTISSLGYGANDVQHDPEETLSRDQLLVRRFGISFALAMFVMMFSVPVWSGYLPTMPPAFRDWLGYGLLTLSTPVLFWGGWPFLRGAWSSLIHRIPTMDLLIAIGTLSAYFYSVFSLILGKRYLYFDTASMLIAFLLFSKILEVGTRNRAGGLNRLLAQLKPPQVRKLHSSGELVTVPADDIRPGEQIVVFPGDRIGADATIIQGASTLDESVLTGESLPVDKSPGQMIYAGTINHEGRLIAEVVRLAQESLVEQIQSYVKSAQEARGPWRTFADRTLRIFVPFVLLFGLATLGLSHYVFHLTWGLALLRMTAVFVIACPCALSVATPLAVMAGSERLSRSGILLKSGDAIERLAAIDTVVFDKTGTLTYGRMRVNECWPPQSETLFWAACAETGSEHPIARAVIQRAADEDISLHAGEDFQALPGIGMSARIDGHHVEVIRFDMEVSLNADLRRKVEEWHAHGNTVSIVRVDGDVIGGLAIADSLREDSAETIRELTKRHYRVAVLSGDHSETLRHLDLDMPREDLYGSQKPLEKAEWIATQQHQGHHVLFVGDGINDSPALVKADLGVAMVGGSDIARESGHMTLTRPSVHHIVDALDRGKMVSRIIRQNLIWAFLYNLLALPLAAFGYTGPLIAAAAMLVSSAFVLGNSLRILGWSPKRYIVGAISVAFVGGLLFSLAWFGI